MKSSLKQRPTTNREYNLRVVEAHEAQVQGPLFGQAARTLDQRLALKQKLQVFSSSNLQRKLFKLVQLQKLVTFLAVVGFLGAGLSYFFLISLEFEVSKNINKLDKQMKVREDLKSYLGRTYSWANLSQSAKANHLSHAQNIEVMETNDSFAHSLFDITEEI